MDLNVILAIFVPFFGTLIGSSCVLFTKNSLDHKIKRILSGTAAGVMVAAAVMCLIERSIEESESFGNLSFLPVVIGFWLGIIFLIILDKIVHSIHDHDEDDEHNEFSCGYKMVFAMILHNIPEGMALGIMLSSVIADPASSIAAALPLSIGIAIHNFPVGAIISLPLHAEGLGKLKSFMLGLLVGIIEPIATIVTMLAASVVVPMQPYLLSFAAGAMMYVVVDELIPEMSEGKHSNVVTAFFGLGFTVMLLLEIILG